LSVVTLILLASLALALGEALRVQFGDTLIEIDGVFGTIGRADTLPPTIAKAKANTAPLANRNLRLISDTPPLT
jgi:hypothetical protein